MIKTIHSLGGILAVMLVCSASGAQGRGGELPRQAPPVRAVPVAGSSVQASATVSHAARRTRIIQASPSGQAPFGTVSVGRAIGVPGLGFDYPHLAAISGGVTNHPPVDFSVNPDRGRRHRGGSILPILYGGYPYYDYVDSVDYEQPQQQPQIIVIQQPAPVPKQVVELVSRPVNPPEIPALAPVASPVRELGDLILVRRDGRILFASAFSVAGGQLHYVTPEGIRRTLSLADLDADATREMNEARGTAIQIHN